MRPNSTLKTVLIFVMLMAMGSSHAGAPPPPSLGSLTINVQTEIIQMDLAGTGLMPLATDPGNLLGDSVSGYGFVDTQAIFSESSSLVSDGLTTIFLDLNTLTGSITSSFNFFLDMQLTDIDDRAGRDFAGQADGGVISIAADGAKPLSATVSADITLDLGTGGLALSNLVEVAPTIERSLGVDVNDNGNVDSIFYSLSGLSLLVEDVAFGDISSAVVSSLGSDVVLDVTGSLGITASGITFSGDVADLVTDPPFSFPLNGSLQSASVINEPTSLVMMILGLIGVVALGRRRSA